LQKISPKPPNIWEVTNLSLIPDQCGRALKLLKTSRLCLALVNWRIGSTALNYFCPFSHSRMALIVERTETNPGSGGMNKHTNSACSDFEPRILLPERIKKERSCKSPPRNKLKSFIPIIWNCGRSSQTGLQQIIWLYTFQSELEFATPAKSNCKASSLNFAEVS